MPSVEAVLRQRGWGRVRHSSTDGLLLPPQATPDLAAQYYADLTRYHFRRLLQEAVELRSLGPTAVRRLRARWGAPAVAQTFDRLVAYGLLRRRGPTYTLAAPHGVAFGDTLEWFVAQVFMREFAAPAAWDVRIGEISAGATSTS